MQKFISIVDPTGLDCKDIQEQYLNDGWNIKSMVGVNERLFIVFEKETRKEKLEHLNNLNDESYYLNDKT